MTLECKTCSYFIDQDWGIGTCVRYPRTEQKDEHDWCGEYKAHPAGRAVVPFGGKQE